MQEQTAEQTGSHGSQIVDIFGDRFFFVRVNGKSFLVSFWRCQSHRGFQVIWRGACLGCLKGNFELPEQTITFRHCVKKSGTWFVDRWYKFRVQVFRCVSVQNNAWGLKEQNRIFQILRSWSSLWQTHKFWACRGCILCCLSNMNSIWWRNIYINIIDTSTTEGLSGEVGIIYVLVFRQLKLEVWFVCVFGGGGENSGLALVSTHSWFLVANNACLCHWNIFCVASLG